MVRPDLTSRTHSLRVDLSSLIPIRFSPIAIETTFYHVWSHGRSAKATMRGVATGSAVRATRRAAAVDGRDDQTLHVSAARPTSPLRRLRRRSRRDARDQTGRLDTPPFWRPGTACDAELDEGDLRCPFRDPNVAAEVAAFISDFRVNRTVEADLISGCPHQEGIDYPMGRTCPAVSVLGGHRSIHARTGPRAGAVHGRGRRPASAGRRRAGWV